MFDKPGACLLLLVSSPCVFLFTLVELPSHIDFEGTDVLITFGSVSSESLLGNLVTLVENTFGPRQTASGYRHCRE